MSENKSMYGVKCVYKHTVTDGSVFYEEQILTVMAESFDEAIERARKYADFQCGEHTNPMGDAVKTELHSMPNCFLAFDDEDGVREVYSNTVKNKLGLTERNFLASLLQECTKEEMYPLRYAEFN